MTTKTQIVRRGEVDSKRWFTRYPMPFAVLKSGELSPDCAVPVAVIDLSDKAKLAEWLRCQIVGFGWGVGTAATLSRELADALIGGGK